MSQWALTFAEVWSTWNVAFERVRRSGGHFGKLNSKFSRQNYYIEKKKVPPSMCFSLSPDDNNPTPLSSVAPGQQFRKQARPQGGLLEQLLMEVKCAPAGRFQEQLSARCTFFGFRSAFCETAQQSLLMWTGNSVPPPVERERGQHCYPVIKQLKEETVQKVSAKCLHVV